MPLDCTTYVDDLTETEREARDDLWRWLGRFPDRVPALLEAVREGQMHGNTYVGICRCVMGNLWSSEPFWDYSSPWASQEIAPSRNPIESFVQSECPGDTPANSPVMAKLERWIVQWQTESA